MPEIRDERAHKDEGYVEAIRLALSADPRRRQLGPIVVLGDEVPGRTVTVSLWKGTLPEHGTYARIRAGSPSELWDQLIAYLSADVPLLEPGNWARVVIPSRNGCLQPGTIVLIMASHDLALGEVMVRTEDGTERGRIYVEQLERIDHSHSPQ
jgi:hypothetical protein